MISLHDVLEASNGQLFGEPAAHIFTDFCFAYRRAKEAQLFVARRVSREFWAYYAPSRRILIPRAFRSSLSRMPKLR